MKVLSGVVFAVLVVAFHLANVSAQVTVPTFDCADDGYFPVTPGERCNPEYITCVNGTAYLNTCPGGAVFDPDSFLCKSPSTVNCTISTLDPSVTTTAPIDFVCPDSDGYFSLSNGTCAEYFIICISSTPYLEVCPGSNLFDPVQLICVDPSNCQDTTSTSTETQTTSTTTPINFACPEPDGNFPLSEGICAENYVICTSSVPFLTKCPGDYFFDPVQLVCVDPSTCQGSTVTTSTSSETEDTTNESTNDSTPSGNSTTTQDTGTTTSGNDLTTQTMGGTTNNSTATGTSPQTTEGTTNNSTGTSSTAPTQTNPSDTTTEDPNAAVYAQLEEEIYIIAGVLGGACAVLVVFTVATGVSISRAASRLKVLSAQDPVFQRFDQYRPGGYGGTQSGMRAKMY